MTRIRGPGPNRYQLPSTIGMTNHDPTREKAPGYSFGSRYSYKTVYGPGPYGFDTGVSNRGRINNNGAVIYGRPKKSIWEINSSSSPGPAYAVNRQATERRPPTFSFGSPPPKKKVEKAAPAPLYDVPSSFGRNTKGAIIGSRATGAKGFSHDYANSPGPAHYGNVNENNKSRGPAFTIGTRNTGPKQKWSTPGPNQYNPPYNYTTHTSPRFTMGIRHHEEVITMADVSD